MIEVKGHGHVWSGIWTKEIVVWDAKVFLLIVRVDLSNINHFIRNSALLRK